MFDFGIACKRNLATKFLIQFEIKSERVTKVQCGLKVFMSFFTKAIKGREHLLFRVNYPQKTKCIESIGFAVNSPQMELRLVSDAATERIN